MIVDSRHYSHVVDPVSGCLVESVAGVSVVAGRCLVAVAASTLAC
jgi:thiamine biosynthesis lipoprotein ApbE